MSRERRRGRRLGLRGRGRRRGGCRRARRVCERAMQNQHSLSQQVEREAGHQRTVREAKPACCPSSASAMTARLAMQSRLSKKRPSQPLSAKEAESARRETNLDLSRGGGRPPLRTPGWRKGAAGTLQWPTRVAQSSASQHERVDRLRSLNSRVAWRDEDAPSQLQPSPPLAHPASHPSSSP